MQVLKPALVVATGAGLALVLAAAAFLVVSVDVGVAVVDGDSVEATRAVLDTTGVVLVHLLWIITWCVWRSLGRARFVAAALLVPPTGLLVWAGVALAWEVSTRGHGWVGGDELLSHDATGRNPVILAAVLVPAAVVAISVLVTVLVPAHGPSASLLVRPAWVPRTLLRGTAITAAVLGGAALTAILAFVVLAMTGVG